MLFYYRMITIRPTNFLTGIKRQGNIALQRHFVIPSLRSRTGLRSEVTKNLDFIFSICPQIVDSSLSRLRGITQNDF